MEINIYLTDKVGSSSVVLDYLKEECHYTQKYSEYLIKNNYEEFISTLRNELVLVIEYPYVDKFYRDCYYNYYSSKLEHYSRFSLRVSIFEPGIENEDFENEVGKAKLQSKFLGYFLIRPTHPQIIGRNVISPLAFINNNFKSCFVRTDVTINSIKLIAEGFPHSSQDTETITCAETTIWSCMEYFGNKYSDYQPIKPSKIIELLKNHSFERQIPSKGLNVRQISAALKDLGFGSIIYSLHVYGAQFESLLGCYVESGIPIILAMQNSKNINHAILSIGREEITSDLIDKCPVSMITKDKTEIIDLNSAKCRFVFIDDNHPPYQLGLYDSPCDYYKNADWQACKITHFIVPLYPKIYLEAFRAKSFINSVLLDTGYFNIAPASKIHIRYFLASSRSYKEHIALNPTLNAKIKKIITSTSMPKFIWVAELTTADLVKGNPSMANGLIIVDATEANTTFMNPLIIGLYNDVLLTFAPKIRDFDKITLPYEPFHMYSGNLKSFSP